MSTRRARFAAVLVAALFLSAAMILRGGGGCGEGFERGDDPLGGAAANLLLVTVESLGPGDLAAAEEGAFPALAAFARAGAVFEDAIAASPDPVAALASLLASKRPSAHGVATGRDEPLDGDATSLAIALRSRGFATEAFVASSLPIASLGLLRGFDSFDDGGDGGNGASRSAAALTDAALAAPAGPARRFTWVHFGGAAARGDGGREIERLIAHRVHGRGAPAPTLAIVVGLGSAAHPPPPSDPLDAPLPDAAILTSFVLGGLAGVPRGVRVRDLVSALDVAPTALDALDALDLPPESAFEGTSVLPVLLGGHAARAHAPVEARDPFDRAGAASLRGVVTSEFVFCDVSGESDLRRRDAALRALGPDESEDLPETVQDMRRRLRDSRGGRGGGGSRSRADSRRGGSRGRDAGRSVAAAASDAPRAIAIARALADGGDFGAALDACDDALAETPEEPRLLVARGEIFLRAGDAESARRDATEALRLDPGSPFAHALAGRAARQRHDLESAERALRRAAELRPRSPGAAAEWGSVLFALGRFADSAVAFESASRLDPTSSDFLVALARALLATASETAEDGAAARVGARAEEALRLAIARDPRRADSRLLLADLLESRGGARSAAPPAEDPPAEALDHLRAAAEADPSSAAVHARYAAALERAGAPGEAAVAYRRTLVLEPDRTEALLGLASLLGGEDRAEARKCLERAVASNPRLAAARRALGESLLADGETAAGLRELEEAAFLAPGDPEGFALLGTALAAAGRPHAAEDAFRRALAAGPSHAGALSALSRLLATGAEGFPRRPMESVELSRRGVTMHPSDPAAWSALAHALDSFGKRDEAADARLREARLHLQARRPADAIAVLDACALSSGESGAERVKALRREAEALAAAMAGAASGTTTTTTERPGDARR